MSRRILRLNELIKREVSKILLRDIDFPKDILVTVTRVETSNDLKEARVWISVFPEKGKEIITKILNPQIYIIQQKINKTIKMKPLPKLKFIEEKEVKKAARVEELLEKIKNE